MGSTLVIACSRCGGLLLAKIEQRTRTCPYCGAKVDVEKAKTVASAASAYEASEILRRLKNQAQSTRGSVSHQS